MGLLIEEDIKQDLARKMSDLQDLHRELRRRIGPEVLPVVDVVKAIGLAAATVRDCAVCQENHASGIIRLEAETLGDTFLALRAAETILKDVIAGLIVASGGTT